MSFFFFKQKTAYEMRISDWSSDVCSSDLVAALPDLADERRRQVVAQPVAALGENLRLVGPDLLVQLAQRRFLGGLAGVDAALRHLPDELGRASCRESVCQYV